MESTADQLKHNKTLKEQSRFYRLNLIWSRLRHGLFLFSLRNMLTRVGIDIFPYWIEKEGLTLSNKPLIKDNPDLYKIRPMKKVEVEELSEDMSWLKPVLNNWHQVNFKAIGLYRVNELAAFMMARFNDFEFKTKRFSLDVNEAYLENMYTMENFRGKNLAPYLRYKVYQILGEEHKTVFYSVTQYFNKSSLKFKAKLNAQHCQLWLHICLFKKLKWNFLLKDYGKGQPIVIKS